MSNKISQQAMQNILPKLRFPEFRYKEGWEKKNIGDNDFATIYKGKGISKSEVVQNGKTLCIRYGELYTYYGEVIDQVISKTNCPESDLFLSRKNDVVIPASGETKVDIATASCINLSNVALGSDLNIIRSKHNGIFISYSLNGPLKNEIARVAQGNSVVHLYPSQLQKIGILVPTIQEQKKIADCLFSIDELITAESKKLDTLKVYKKGLMQQLFPAEGETLPKLRFPEFKYNPEWKKVLLGSVCKFVRGPFGGSLKKEIFVKHGYAVYEQSHAIYQNFNDFRYYINDDTYNKLRRFSVSPNDLIMSCSGTMGKFAIIPTDVKEGVINQALLKLTVNKDYDAQFIKLILELENNQEQLLSQAGGGAIKNVASVDQIKTITFYIPNKNEQQKIADCINSIDILTAAQSNKIEGLKNHKKGLMQQLFPSMSEL
ncbi:restriction endonuclease subunit S [Legionella pneumophila serogroup 2]